MAEMTNKQRFFETIAAIQSGKKQSQEVPLEIRKLAKTMNAGDVGKFCSSKADLREKKALLATLKEIRGSSASVLQEDDSTQEVNPIAKTFTIKDNFDQFVKKHIGQPILPKELEALDNFQDVKPTKIERTQVTYETSDAFGNNTSTIIKKMKDSGQFSFNAFQKTTKVEKKEPEDEAPPESPEPESNGPGAPAPEPAPEVEQNPTSDKDDIMITKSTLFTDDIKGGALFVDFLKKLDL
jgi:hypothetical protein